MRYFSEKSFFIFLLFVCDKYNVKLSSGKKYLMVYVTKNKMVFKIYYRKIQKKFAGTALINYR